MMQDSESSTTGENQNCFSARWPFSNKNTPNSHSEASKDNTVNSQIYDSKTNEGFESDDTHRQQQQQNGLVGFQYQVRKEIWYIFCITEHTGTYHVIEPTYN